jgi:hypothetical protein
MADKHLRPQTAEWLVTWNALDTLEEFWRAREDGVQGAAVDRVLELRARMIVCLQRPSLIEDPAPAMGRARQQLHPASWSARSLAATARSAAGIAKIPPPLQPAYASLASSLQQLSAALQLDYGQNTQAESFRQYLTCLQDTLIDLAATLEDSPPPRTLNGARAHARSSIGYTRGGCS